jgi:hypothetical protein
MGTQKNAGDLFKRFGVYIANLGILSQVGEEFVDSWALTEESRLSALQSTRWTCLTESANGVRKARGSRFRPNKRLPFCAKRDASLRCFPIEH